MINALTKNNFFAWLTLPDHSPSLRKVRSGTQAGVEAGTEEYLFPGFCSASFGIHPSPTPPGMALPAWKCANCWHSHDIFMEAIPQLRFPFARGLYQYQTDKKSSQHTSSDFHTVSTSLYTQLWISVLFFVSGSLPAFILLMMAILTVVK